MPTNSIDQSSAEQTFEQFKSAQTARDETLANIELSKATLAESKAQRDQAEIAVKVAEAKADSAEADRRQTAAMLDYTKIKAPFDGVVTHRNVDAGWLVQIPSGAMPAAPLFVVTRTDTVRVFLDVPEADAAQVRDGMAAQVRIAALQDQEFNGQVTRSSYTLDTQSRTLHAEIDLPNPKGLLRPGLYAVIKMMIERPGAADVAPLRPANARRSAGRDVR